MNLAPGFRSEGLVVILLIALLFIPSGSSSRGGAGISSEGRHCPLLDPARTVQNAITGSASLPKSSPFSAVPSSLFSFDEPQGFSGTCPARERSFGVTKLLDSKCCLSKTPQTRDSSADSPAGLFLMEWCFKQHCF